MAPALHLVRPQHLSADDDHVSALRAGSEAALRALAATYAPRMLRAAQLVLGDERAALAEVGAAWRTALAQLDGRRPDLALRLWLLALLGERLRSLGALDETPAAPARVELEAFLPANHPRWPDCWSRIVTRWDVLPELVAARDATHAAVAEACARMPVVLRTVLVLRDVDGWSAAEVSVLLGLEAAVQRRLLHAGRLAVRAELERRMGD